MLNVVRDKVTKRCSGQAGYSSFEGQFDPATHEQVTLPEGTPLPRDLARTTYDAATGFVPVPPATLDAEALAARRAQADADADLVTAGPGRDILVALALELLALLNEDRVTRGALPVTPAELRTRMRVRLGALRGL